MEQRLDKHCKPFRASIVLGSVPVNLMPSKQLQGRLRKALMYIYDFKFDDLFHHCLQSFIEHRDKYKSSTKILCDKFRMTHARAIGAIHQSRFYDRHFSDAYEAAYTIMLNSTVAGYRSKGIFSWKAQLSIGCHYLVSENL